jgi:hypothetical protein
LPLIENHEGKSVEKLRRTKLRDAGAQTRWLDAIMRHVRLALDRKSQFVVLPEFALPPDVDEKLIADEIKKIADEYDHEYFLFSGSRHEGIYNRGFLLSRQAEETEATKIWWHYKVASARGLGENIMGPQTVKVPGYNFTLKTRDGLTVEYRVFVAICYDVFDPTTFINYLIQCADSDSGFYESIILVPSFNPAREFVDALRDLSFVARCPVIYVNGLHGDAKLFLYGVEIADLVAAEESSLDDASPEPSRLDQSMQAMRERLRSQAQEEMQRFRAVSRMYDNAEDVAAKRIIRSVLDSIRRRKLLLDAREMKLRDFYDQLASLRRQGVLKHLITTESCDNCTDKAHDGDAYCPKDVLYYNIDIRLIRELQKFRNDYFAADDFLPLPFRREEREKIFSKIRDKRERKNG